MARINIEVKDKTKLVVVNKANKKGITVKELILTSLGIVDA